MADLLEEFAEDAPPLLIQTATQPGSITSSSPSTTTTTTPWIWTPMCRRVCEYGPEAFSAVMQNLVRNPNQLSSWLFRADIVYPADEEEEEKEQEEENRVSPAALPVLAGLALEAERTIVRRLVPRNTLRDRPMLQTCAFYGPDGAMASSSVVVYLPHVAAAVDMPFYHPNVRGVAFCHAWQPSSGMGTLSVHFAMFLSDDNGNDDPKNTRAVLARVARNLALTVHKHGEGQRAGYVKRVHHDRLVPQARVQDRYTRLKERHARRLVTGWQETTDPAKHVFEDLCIAAFLLELWADMYDNTNTPFPGFVDVGCGNGLLVHILRAEGRVGWGFDARARRSWPLYSDSDADVLQARLLLPWFLTSEPNPDQNPDQAQAAVHDGRFPPGTFLIANHADELTAWTPLLAALSGGCPFLAIPCCSHNFTGSKFRAPRPSAAQASSANADSAAGSTYASFVAWVAGVGTACGWTVEREMLRIPSTRNVGLLGRHRTSGNNNEFSIDDAWHVIQQHGGAHGFAHTVAKLAAEHKRSDH